MTESELFYNLPSTRFNIQNEEDLDDALETNVKQINLQIENLEGTRSNLRFKGITSTTIHFDK